MESWRICGPRRESILFRREMVIQNELVWHREASGVPVREMRSWTELTTMGELPSSRSLGLRLSYAEFLGLAGEWQGFAGQIEVVLVGEEIATALLAHSTEHWRRVTQITLVPLKTSYWKSTLSNWLARDPGRVRFAFPIPDPERAGFLSCAEIQDWLKDNPRAKAPDQYELYNPDLEPQLYSPAPRLVLQRAPLSLRPGAISFIIPSYNRGENLQQTLLSLASQKFAEGLFEVVIVDDGSADNTIKLISELADLTGKLNWQLWHWPRHQARQAGDNQFRAGVARNLGVEKSRGDYLCFLDSDILVPPNFVVELLTHHSHYEVIQPRRLQLAAGRSYLGRRYEEILPQIEVIKGHSPYWESFQEETQDWSRLPDGWRYASSFCLSMSRRDFLEAGGFSEGFCNYGLEDTDLGFRLWQLGKKFHLSRHYVYHQPPTPGTCEYANDSTLRERLLKRSASYFFLNRLHPDIFRTLEYYLNSPGYVMSPALVSAESEAT